MNTPPPRKRPREQIQLNRLFDSEQEMREHVASQYKGSTIVRFWEVMQFAVVIQLPEKEQKQFSIKKK